GQARGQIATNENGEAWINLYDSQGRPRAGLTVGTDGAASLKLADSDGRNRVMLALNAQGSPALSLADARGQARGIFALEPHGPSLMLFDVKPPRVAFLRLAEQGFDSLDGLRIVNSSGETAVGLHAT